MSNISVSNISHHQCAVNRAILLSSSSSTAKSYYLSISMLAFTMTPVTVIINCIFMATLLSQKIIYKSLSNKLLMVLCMVDLLQGISTWPITAANSFIFYRFEINCFLLDLNHFLAHCLSQLTVCAIFIVSLEQYIAILYPYFYISSVTFYRLLGPMLASNILMTITNIVGAMKPIKNFYDYYNVTVLALGLPMVMALIYIHLRIIRCASQVAARITTTNKEEGKQIKSRARAAKSGLVVLVATLVCYCPYFCYIVYEKVIGPTAFTTNFIKYPATMFALLTSVTDPIIYFWRLKSLRKATKDMFASLSKSKRVGHQ